MRSEMDSMGSNQVWTLVYQSKGVKPVGYNGSTSETSLPVVIAKSIWILLTIAAWYDYEIWQMDVKTAFLNGFVEEEIYRDLPEGFTYANRNRWSVVSKGPFMASKKLPKAGTHVLMKLYGVMISSRTSAILVYTERSVGTQFLTLCFM
ncbi:UNVERIFIED_CONTAM: hypothetical protein Scaly_2895700 [Sesamum calycinum]|uniref:Reverse transcriptase Ty1/copia-type domain-containing protein n=1 Tax=Sesamum calycinum TaxID=2727403 RepID=A0AAW2L9A5_9LAMI